MRSEFSLNKELYIQVPRVCAFASVLMYLCTAIYVRVYSRWVSPRHYHVDSMILLPENPIKCHQEFLSLQLIYYNTVLVL